MKPWQISFSLPKKTNFGFDKKVGPVISMMNQSPFFLCDSLPANPVVWAGAEFFGFAENWLLRHFAITLRAGGGE
jgi:hypothetical protein